jgi:hypothetical protein
VSSLSGPVSFHALSLSCISSSSRSMIPIGTNTESLSTIPRWWYTRCTQIVAWHEGNTSQRRSFVGTNETPTVKNWKVGEHGSRRTLA